MSTFKSYASRSRERQAWADNDRLPVLAEFVLLPAALLHPLLGEEVLRALLDAGLVAVTGACPEHGDSCFLCGKRWALHRKAAGAVLCPPAEAYDGFVGLVCHICVARGPERLRRDLEQVLHDVLGWRDARVLTATGRRR